MNQPPPPPVIQIRIACMQDADSIARIHVQAWQQSYKGIIDQSFLDQISFEKRLALRKEVLQKANSLYLVALVDDRIVGFCDAGPHRYPSPFYQGEIYAIYLLDDYKQLGIGTKLLEEATTYLHHKGLIPFIAWVLENNTPARNFYSKHGGKITQEKKVKIGKHTYKEIAYLFNDLKTEKDHIR